MFRAQAATSRPVHPSVMASGNETGVSTPFIPCHTAWGSARQVQKKKASSPQRLSAGAVPTPPGRYSARSSAVTNRSAASAEKISTAGRMRYRLAGCSTKRTTVCR